MQKLIVYGVLPVMVLLCGMCQQAREIKAFTEADYGLEGVEDVRLNGIPLEERLQAGKQLTPQERDELLAAISGNNLLLSATMALFVSLREPSADQSLTMTSMEWLLLVDGKEALTGTVDETMVLRDGPNVFSIQTPVQLTEANGIPNYEGLSRVINLINRKENIREAVTFQIKPTIKTPLGNIEAPAFISVAEP